MSFRSPGYGSVKGTPSIAAVVASIDDKFGQFPASLRIQKSKQEVGPRSCTLDIHTDMRRRWVQMIAQLDEMFVERLLDFKARNANKLPSNIVFWRDGVSEGQFDQVIRDELPLIQKAFADKAFSPNPAAPYKPNLTIVICGSCVALRRELSLIVRGRDR
jgi:eukaryotic translation initiation factor 2C